MTWADTGAKQVSVIGVDEKRAFTVLASVAANGTLLPFQAIYEGLTNRLLPESSTPNYDEVIDAGFLLEFSGTKTYWSNQQTMRSFVDNILAPYFDAEKVKLNLPPRQKALGQIDVWSVHRSKEFRNWMGEHHLRICLDFVPGGCTGVHQPCDVGIQRPFKLSVKRSYHEDIVKEILAQMDKGKTTLKIDDRLPVLRNRSV
jgi:hypothetical protein